MQDHNVDAPFKRSSCYDDVQFQSLLSLSGGSPYPRMDGRKIATELASGRIQDA